MLVTKRKNIETSVFTVIVPRSDSTIQCERLKSPEDRSCFMFIFGGFFVSQP